MVYELVKTTLVDRTALKYFNAVHKNERRMELRYFTKQLEDTTQFYMILFSMFMPFEKYMEHQIEMTHSKDYINSNLKPEQQSFYYLHVKQNYKKTMLYCDEMDKVIFDENNNIRMLDENIYSTILIYTKKLVDLLESNNEIVFANRNKIKNGNYSKEIKDLAKFNKHDATILSLKYENCYTELLIKDLYDVLYGYRFKISVENKIKVLLDGDIKIVHEELYPHPDNTLTYHLLLMNWSEVSIDDEYIELSIRFEELITIDYEKAPVIV